MYSLNEHFGTKKEFLALVDRAHALKMWVMVDVVGRVARPCFESCS